MRKKRKLNLPLIEVVVVSLVVHVAGLAILGGLTIWSVMTPDESEMQAPPIPPKPQEQLEQTVRLDKSLQNSAKPTARIAVTNLSQINLPDLNLDMPVVESRVSVGLGVHGSGRRGFGNGSIDFAKSTVDFFGIQDKGENVAFILDTARSMVEPERGDVGGYARVKEEISGMINNLKPGTLFNIYAFDENLEMFRGKPVAASTANREAASRWIDRFWKYQNGRFTYQGARGFDQVPDMKGLPIRRSKIVQTQGEKHDPDAEFSLQDLSPQGQRVGEGSSRMDLAILAAAEGGADVIFMLTDGTPMVQSHIDERDLREFQRKYADYWKKAAGDPAYEKWQKEMAAFRDKVQKYQENRIKRGLPPETREGGYPGGMKPPAPPKELGWPPGPNWDPMPFNSIVQMIAGRTKEIYRSRESPVPPLHVVGYSTGDEEKSQMEDLQRYFRGGKFRVITKKDIAEMRDRSGES